jgi:hypothetical protein
LLLEVLIHIEVVPRGKTALGCPYCGGSLRARKGRIKAHHFAHTEATCRAVERREVPLLPFYDRFDLGLSPKALAILHEQWERYGVHGRSVHAFGYDSKEQGAYGAPGASAGKFTVRPPECDNAPFYM